MLQQWYQLCAHLALRRRVVAQGDLVACFDAAPGGLTALLHSADRRLYVILTPSLPGNLKAESCDRFVKEELEAKGSSMATVVNPSLPMGALEWALVFVLIIELTVIGRGTILRAVLILLFGGQVESASAFSIHLAFPICCAGFCLRRRGGRTCSD